MSLRAALITGFVCVALWLGWLVPAAAAEIATLETAAGETAAVDAAAVDAAAAPARTSVAVLAAEARFNTNADELSSGGQAGLSKLIDALETYEQILSIRVVGHTDSVGADEYNRRLSARRALTISRFIQRRFPKVQIVAIGAGESTPIASNDTVAGRDRNRRVELHVVATAVKPDSG